ncbi:MAG: gamma-glutamyl-gamma-aminobutyrate hydrolase family protein [Cytophagaceae bacterium]|nr:gamma-glutamyl-gamma-aminobutyrate hydrolase family protein [Cytophagaceae bacterium]MDW8455826.1 gamma-glutamyl-gamma-aminobutyrate hydrolase family protein [Cytophagaceae bacterium]
MSKLLIGITDCSKYDNYANWILASEKNVEVCKLSEKHPDMKLAQCCHGILFTGGEDVHPRFYNKPEYIEYCHIHDMNERRDDFELNLLHYTQQNKIPVLGICRGLQIANVFFGGTLIPDLPTWKKPDNSKLTHGEYRYHQVSVASDSWMQNLIGKASGRVNSNHHQAADEIGKGLRASAFSDGHVVEAIERIDADSMPFLCLVQWHPERMDEQKSPFVYKIRDAFLDACLA